MAIVIVALPSEDEKVHKISSEKVAHLTLMYLGESVPTMDIPDIVTFVDHVAKDLDPFYLSVDYRDTLGDDEADVLFFEKNMWEFPRLKQFRHNLLLNESIKKAHDSTEQFDEFQPHLTLGYPGSPAHKDPDNDPPKFYGVQFDRIAVWFGDYEGPEIRLKYDYHGDTEMAMHSDLTRTLSVGENAVEELFLHEGMSFEDAIEHYGKKGMKWGVTTTDRASSVTKKQDVAAKKGAKDVTVTQRKAGTLVKSKGGERQKATDEAIKAQGARQKAKKSTTDALTNDELKAAVERMNLEQQFSKLTRKSERQSLGQMLVEAMFSDKN